MADAAHKIVDWDQLYPGRFLKAGLLGNERRLLTIADIQLEELETETGKRGKGIVSFREEPLRLALNKTNGICLREMFGRVPYKWMGKRIALFQTTWGDDPAIRIWGSPDITEDMIVSIQLPKRRAFNMTMHAMGDERSLQRAGAKAAKGMTRGSDRYQELLKLMSGAKTENDLTDIEADMATEQFTDRESATLAKAVDRRRAQLRAAAAETTTDEEGPSSNDIPY